MAERGFGFSRCNVGELFVRCHCRVGRGTVGSTKPRGRLVKLSQLMGGDVVEVGRGSPLPVELEPYVSLALSLVCLLFGSVGCALTWAGDEFRVVVLDFFGLLRCLGSLRLMLGYGWFFPQNV